MTRKERKKSDLYAVDQNVEGHNADGENDVEEITVLVISQMP